MKKSPQRMKPIRDRLEALDARLLLSAARMVPVPLAQPPAEVAAMAPTADPFQGPYAPLARRFPAAAQRLGENFEAAVEQRFPVLARRLMIVHGRQNHPPANNQGSPMNDPSPDFADVKRGPLAKAGPNLIAIFLEHRDFKASGAEGPFQSSASNLFRVEGEAVGVQIRVSGNFDQAVDALRKLGMRELATESTLGIVEGMLPIEQVPTVAQAPRIIGLSPLARPQLRR